ncbi:GA-binding protein subunit beta-1-like [Ostrea edulis]|uniref:GA-binding protein subunit beta-1-like n=1 Tax=Ostrea edulis TaxID=37623 RepID=UPI0020960074|nr:GA-binding protein subunit beta-1-like [Ostrea edulis]XP_048750008.1 GA-binding protein subunit beta-1-like [Ostrea edulis]XP_056001965.1 GA-binding protein subunit beta-1-like [Ostrea edulis]
MSASLTEEGLDQALVISTVEEQIIEDQQAAKEIILCPEIQFVQQKSQPAKEKDIVIFPKSRQYYAKMSLVDLGKRLLEAAKRGETDDVRTLMSNGAPFTTDWLGTSPLHFASQYGHLDTAEVLLRAGISRDARTKVDRTPLHVASQEGHSEIVELLVQHAADVDAKDMLKMTPLHWATEKGHAHVMEALIKHGADTTCENKFDRTPLDIAIANGRADLVQILQLAQHTHIGSMGDDETVTIETTEVDTENVEETVTVSTDLEGDGQDQTNSSVLATLAALAEATAPNTQVSTANADAMTWLESQGITMITTTEGGIISSAMESGQSIALTEAGKIALTNIIKQQGLSPGTLITQDSVLSDDAIVSDDAVVTQESAILGAGEVLEEDVQQELQEGEESQKVITIVAAAGLEENQEGLGEVMVMGSGDATDEALESAEEPPLKKLKSETIEEEDTSIYTNPIETVPSEEGDDLDKESLRRQLEEMQRQAEVYKLQLQQKEEEAAAYKKKLDESIITEVSTEET